MPILALLATFALFAVIYILRERSTVHPVLDLSLLRNRLFAASAISAYISYTAMFIVMFLMPFYMAGVLGYSPERMGLTLIAVPITVAVIAPFSGSLSDRFGSRVIGTIGLTVMSLGLFMISRLSSDPLHIKIIMALSVLGLGSGLFQAPNNSAIMSAVPRGMLGVASGMLAMMRNLGMITGVTVSGAVYASRLILYSGSLQKSAASTHAFRDAFTLGAIICILGMLASSVKGSG